MCKIILIGSRKHIMTTSTNDIIHTNLQKILPVGVRTSFLNKKCRAFRIFKCRINKTHEPHCFQRVRGLGNPSELIDKKCFQIVRCIPEIFPATCFINMFVQFPEIRVIFKRLAYLRPRHFLRAGDYWYTVLFLFKLFEFSRSKAGRQPRMLRYALYSASSSGVRPPGFTSFKRMSASL